MYSGDEAVVRYGGEASVGVIEVWLKHEAPEPTGPDPSGQPVFTPFTVAPRIHNEQEVQRALSAGLPGQLVLGTPVLGRGRARRDRRVQVRARLEPRPTPSGLGELPGHLPGAVGPGAEADLHRKRRAVLAYSGEIEPAPMDRWCGSPANRVRCASWAVRTISGTSFSTETLFATNHKFYGFADLFLNIPRDTAGRGLRDFVSMKS